MTSAATLQPEDIHPTHDVREEGHLCSDPVCQHCRRSVSHPADHQALREPCSQLSEGSTMHDTDNEVTQADLAAVDTIGGHMASYYEFGQSDEYAAAQEAARDFRLASIEAACREKDAEIEGWRQKWIRSTERCRDMKHERDHLRAKLDEAGDILHDATCIIGHLVPMDAYALAGKKLVAKEVWEKARAFLAALADAGPEPVQKLQLVNGAFSDLFREVGSELERAVAKFPTWPSDPFHALAVLGEEYGELQKAVLQFCYEKHKCVTLDDIRSEAVQTAAMALRWLKSLSTYRFEGSEQHLQPASKPGCASCHETNCGGECLG